MNEPISDRIISGPEDVRQLCFDGKMLCYRFADDIRAAAINLRYALRNYEKVIARRRGRAAAFWRPRVVAAVLKAAAAYVQTAARLMDKTYVTFLKHYGQDIALAREEAAFKRQMQQRAQHRTNDRRVA